MKYDEITPTLSESRQGNLLLDIEHWHNSAKSIDEIVTLVSKKYKLDVPRDYVEQAIMMAGDESAEALNEVKMSTNIFDQFINSPESDGIQAGFEAELIFTGLGEPEYEGESEIDDSEDRRPHSIEDICDFFHDGNFNGRRDVERLREKLESEFYEWQNEQLSHDWPRVMEEAVEEYIENNDWNEDDEMRSYMADDMGLSEEDIDEAMAWYGAKAQAITSSRQQSELMKTDQSYTNFVEAGDAVDELLKERVQESIGSRDHNYESARESWEEEVRDENSERDWLRDRDYDTMMDVSNEHGITWPYWTDSESSEGGFSVDNAQRLASGLENDIGVNTRVADGYHSVSRRPGLWIFEPDSSLEPDDEDDMPVEIISPPMPLKECLDILPQFYRWAKRNQAYSNESTGFHIGVSLPDVGGRVDYVKLALFLGDQYVLNNFERGSNMFTKSSMAKIRADVTGGKVSPDTVQKSLDYMKSGLIQLANDVISSGKGLGHGHGKYTSINVKGDYIEFRSMGSESYFSNPDSLNKVIETIKRYAYAMYISSQPDLYREEYAKKLYKLLDKDGNAAVEMKSFADYVTAIGGADQQTVKAFITSMKSDNYNDAKLPDRQSAARTGNKPTSAKYWWNVQWDKNRGMEVVASNKKEARIVAAREWGVPVEQLAVAQVTHLRPFKDSPGGVGNWAIKMNGVQVFRVTASHQGEANHKAREWLQGRSQEWLRDHRGQELEVVPV